jgi:GNAT superfamily N-acetyltransferase
VTVIWRSERITDDHELGQFDCGIEELDIWLRTMALRADHQDTARTFVWTAPHSSIVRAYFSIAPTGVKRAGLPRSATGGRTNIPAYLLARLALDSSIQGQGLGAELLLDAMSRIYDATQRSGGRLLVVDPVNDDARSFYLHQGFTPIADSARLFVRSAALRSILSRAGQ